MYPFLCDSYRVIQSVDQKQLLAWLGMKSDARDNALEVKKEMEKAKQQLIEAFAAKGEAMLELKEQDNEKLLDIYTEVVKYTDQTDTKVISGFDRIFSFTPTDFSRYPISCGNSSGIFTFGPKV